MDTLHCKIYNKQVRYSISNSREFYESNHKTPAKFRDIFTKKPNASARVRTHDLVSARQTLYQLRHGDKNLLNGVIKWRFGRVCKKNATQHMIFLHTYMWSENNNPELTGGMQWFSSENSKTWHSAGGNDIYVRITIRMPQKGILLPSVKCFL